MYYDRELENHELPLASGHTREMTRAMTVTALPLYIFEVRPPCILF